MAMQTVKQLWNGLMGGMIRCKKNWIEVRKRKTTTLLFLLLVFGYIKSK